MKTAILFGASGNVGAHLLKILLASDIYHMVKIVVRKDLKIQHPKLVTMIADYSSLPHIKSQVAADDVFIILGSTDKTVERNYPALIARMCKDLGAQSISIVTSVGANLKSSMTFTRIKGEIEQNILQQQFKHTNIFRPGMILGARPTYRPMEKTMMTIWTIIHPLLVGKLNKYRGMEAKDIAQAMYQSAAMGSEGTSIYDWKEMNDIIKTVVSQ